MPPAPTGKAQTHRAAAVLPGNKPPWPLLPYISFQQPMVCYSRTQLFASSAILCFLKQGDCHQCVPACSKLWQGVSLSGKCRAVCSHHYTCGSCSEGLLKPGTKLRNFIWELQAMHEATAPASGSIWYLLASSAAGGLAPTCRRGLGDTTCIYCCLYLPVTATNLDMSVLAGEFAGSYSHLPAPGSGSNESVSQPMLMSVCGWGRQTASSE